MRRLITHRWQSRWRQYCLPQLLFGLPTLQERQPDPSFVYWQFTANTTAFNKPYHTYDHPQPQTIFFSCETDFSWQTQPFLKPHFPPLHPYQQTQTLTNDYRYDSPLAPENRWKPEETEQDKKLEVWGDGRQGRQGARGKGLRLMWHANSVAASYGVIGQLKWRSDVCGLILLSNHKRIVLSMNVWHTPAHRQQGSWTDLFTWGFGNRDRSVSTGTEGSTFDSRQW